MCCDDGEALDLPPAVIEMLARYRHLCDEQGFGWGEDAIPDMFRWARFSMLGPAFDEFAQSGDWAGAVRAAISDEVPAGLVLVTVAADGTLNARTGPPRPSVAGGAVPVDVVLDSAAGHDVTVAVPGLDVPLPAGGAGLQTLDLDTVIIEVSCGTQHLIVDGVVALGPAAALALTSPHSARWSVTDATGGA